MEKKEEIHSKYDMEDFELGDDFYSEEVRGSLLTDDELSPIEEAFMRGYEEAIK